MTETASTLPIPVHVRRDGFDPVPELAALRDEPLSKVTIPFLGDAWLVTRYEDARTVLSDTTHFSNNNGARTWDPDENRNVNTTPGEFSVLISYDPPDHTRLRRMLTPEFTMRRMARLRPRIETLVAERLEAMARAGDAGEDVDLIEAFALPIPSLVICELLGVPYEDREEFQRRSNARLAFNMDLDRQRRMAKEAKEYMAGFVARQRARPGDDLMGMLIREHGDEIGDEELIGLGDLLLVAGHETTANMLGLGTLAMIQDPGLATRVREGEQADVDRAVEEMLRYFSVVHAGIPRFVREDTVLAGQQIRRGEMVMVSLAAANRDPALVEDPDRLDPVREAVAHLAFGHGVHHCLGAPLARMEMRIAFPALIRRFPTLRLAGPYGQVRFREISGVFGLKELPVAW